ncbi:MAG: hypothetical protein KC505_01695 [Myxococcales bacterium]|nr:hypothetical protein [Myxococcales bacterium]USN50351.1 MAG: hypothetical protein H6731_08805 [Myxococcales bacterium]
MYRVNAFFASTIAIYSLCIGAALAHHHLYQKNSFDLENCKELSELQQGESKHFMAKELYQQAFLASFDGNWKVAKAASKCSSLFENGDSKWKIEARIFK